MAVFEGLASAWPVGQVTVADRGVRDGIVHQLYETKYAKVRPSIYSVA
jgi:exopolyphosphatase/pppGpp-phosphohydrolase